MKEVFCLAVILCFCAQHLASSAPQWISSIAGPFSVVIEHIEPCPPEEQPPGVRGLHMNPRRLTRNHNNPNKWYYSGNISTVPLSDDIYGDVALASWSSRGGWKENSHYFKYQGLCKILKAMAPAFWKSMTRQLYGGQTVCPLPSILVKEVVQDKHRNREVKRFEIDTSRHGVPNFFYGKYRATSRTFMTGGPYSDCWQGFGTVVPKVNST